KTVMARGLAPLAALRGSAHERRARPGRSRDDPNRAGEAGHAPALIASARSAVLVSREEPSRCAASHAGARSALMRLALARSPSLRCRLPRARRTFPAAP